MLPALRQVCFADLGDGRSTLAPAKYADAQDTINQQGLLRARILEENGGGPLGFFDLHLFYSPFVIFIPPWVFLQLQSLNAALNKALDNIVERWWTDEEAAFPQRMPLRDYEEDVLRLNSWRHPYVGKQGIWRPDYLIESYCDAAGNPVERVKICEINGRFPYNGSFCASISSQALGEYRQKVAGVKATIDVEQSLKTMLDLFDASRPLHIVKDQWPGVDVHAFANFFREQTGQPVTFVKPSQLAVREPPGSCGESTLCYRKASRPVDDPECSETWDTTEDIYQCSLELYQGELEQIDSAALAKLASSKRCVNDMRTILLVHDKRMLGIVLEEADKLVSTGVLTKAEAQTLKDGIAPTFLSRSPALKAILAQSETDPTTKDSYLLKAIRDGLGIGHLHGEDMSNDDWLARLRALCDAPAAISDQTHVVQKVVEQVWYDIRRLDRDDVERYHLVPTYFSVNGRYMAHGPIRIANKWNIKCKDGEGGIMLSSVTDDDERNGDDDDGRGGNVLGYES